MPLIFLQLFAIYVLTQRTIVRYTSSIKKNKHTNGKEENEMKKYKIYFRINEYLIERDYEEVIGDIDSRIYDAESEEEAVKKLHEEIDKYLSETLDLEICSIEEV